MFGQVLLTQWKWSRMELGVYAVLGFGIPTTFVKMMAIDGGAGQATIESAIGASTGLGIVLAVLAFMSGGALSVRPWVKDDAQKHVLALSLPIRWADFVRLRFVAGASLLLVPTFAVWVGGMLASLTLTLPDTLHAYPASVALRFLSACLVFYSAIFALQYIAGKRAPYVFAALLIAVLGIELVWQGVTGGRGSAVLWAWRLVTTWPGPFEVITARWMLIDV